MSLIATRRALWASVAGGGAALSFLLRDDFTTDESAPLTSPRTAEPGPGTLTLVQTDGEFSISGEALSFPAQSTATWGDQGFHAEGFARQAGRCLLATFNFSDPIAAFAFGWLQSEAVSNGMEDGYRTSTTGTFAAFSDVSASTSIAAGAAEIRDPLSSDTDTVLAIILRSSGAFYVDQSAQTLLYVSAAISTGTVYPVFSNFDAAGTLDTFRVTDLPAPFSTDHGIATDRHAGSVSAGQTFSHESDMLGEFEATTLPSSGQIEWRFRVQDATNYWQVTVNSSGDVELDEVVSGSPTQRGSSAGAVSAGDRIVVIADGTTIRVYVDNSLEITYSSASNFQNETDGELESLGTGGAVSDVVTWPRQLTGTAANLLDQAVS